jgi:N-acetylglutamate synthase-like GNAT family acetyltransferase
MKFMRLQPGDPLPMALLLLADEAIEAIERYIDACDVYILNHNDAVIGVVALHHNDPNEIEIKNIAVAENFQGNGLGAYMLAQVEQIARAANYGRVVVGTATIGRQLAFYRKNGFREYDTRKNFFVENYPHPIFEGEEQILDMVMLEKAPRFRASVSAASSSFLPKPCVLTDSSTQSCVISQAPAQIQPAR